ncbi:MAG TPA: glycosyltransferase family 87 protein, partial [Candidatus Dormibacteraeota bacterium]|nr:glycosyltransferase family 87 protein [Candidatus Dormibacteraeota bacterium]
DVSRWRWRGSVAMLGVALAFVIIDITGFNDVVNSDWPSFATGGRLIVSDPTHLYDFEVQRRVELDVTGGRSLVTPGIQGFLPFLAPAWVAFIAVPFELLGTDLGGQLWVLLELACLAFGLYLAVRPRPPSLPAYATVLPAFASVPTALMLLNAQLDGLVALGLGAAIALRSKPYLAGFGLGLTLVKPHLVLPIALALLVTRTWRVIVGWAAAGLVLLASTMALNPRWVLDWLKSAGTTLQPSGPEVDLAHFGTMIPAGWDRFAEAGLALIAMAAVVLLASRRRDDFRSAVAILVAGGVLAAPHALPTDLVLVAVALTIWGEAQWYDWLLLSVGAAIAALTPVPIPTVVGVPTIGWLLLRAAAIIPSWRRGPAPLSTG